MSSGKLTATTETCSIATRLSRRGENFLGIRRGSLRVLRDGYFGMAHHSEPTRQDGATVAFTLCGLAGLPKPGGGREADSQTDGPV